MTSSTEKPDTVYLYQFPRSKELPNISPYCLKVETFLKVNKIPYECVYTMSGRSKQGLLPFIKLNGEQIDDSELILHKLAKHFSVPSLDPRDEALSHSVSRMVDSHMSNVIYKYKGLGDPEGSQWVEGMLRGQGYDKKVPGPLFKGMLYMDDYEKDVVYLYQFPRGQSIPSVSPFCLKIETFLKANKIPYKNVYTQRARSKQGLLPYVTLNGQQIDDSDLIIHKLTKHFELTSLSTKDEAISHALSVLVDQHLFYVMIKFKVLDKEGDLFISNIFRNHKFHEKVPKLLVKPIYKLFAIYFRYRVKKRVSFSVGLFPDQDFQLLLQRDLQAIGHLLGENKFLLGDTLSTVDYTVFAHLASSYYLPYQGFCQEYLDEQFPELVAYMNRVKATIWTEDFTLEV